MKGEAGAMSGLIRANYSMIRVFLVGVGDVGLLEEEAVLKYEGFFKLGGEDVKLLSLLANGQSSMEDSYFIDQH